MDKTEKLHDTDQCFIKRVTISESLHHFDKVFSRRFLLELLD